MHRELEQALIAGGGAISRAHREDLSGQIDYAVRRDEIVRILPGVFAHVDCASDWRVRVAAVGLWNPSAVIVDHAAASLTFWPSKRPASVCVAGVRTRYSLPGFTFTERTVPRSLITEQRGVRLAHPNITALDLADESDGYSIDDALRNRMVTLGGMYKALALTKHRGGNERRRQMLLDSRGEPWSNGERHAHRDLRASGITNWRANVPIWCQGQQFYQDIMFLGCPLVAEVDGKVHMRPDVFESDRRRGNLLLLKGKIVYHFTTSMLQDGLLVPTIEQALALHCPR